MHRAEVRNLTLIRKETDSARLQPVVAPRIGQLSVYGDGEVPSLRLDQEPVDRVAVQILSQRELHSRTLHTADHRIPDQSDALLWPRFSDGQLHSLVIILIHRAKNKTHRLGFDLT